MCDPCLIFKIVLGIWVVGIPIISLLNAYYTGRTDNNLFSSDYENNLAIILLCPLMIPLMVLIATVMLAWDCMLNHWFQLTNYIEQLGKNSKDK